MIIYQTNLPAELVLGSNVCTEQIHSCTSQNSDLEKLVGLQPTSLRPNILSHDADTIRLFAVRGHLQFEPNEAGKAAALANLEDSHIYNRNIKLSI